jgi:hypothetical protein
LENKVFLQGKKISGSWRHPSGTKKWRQHWNYSTTRVPKMFPTVAASLC